MVKIPNLSWTSLIIAIVAKSTKPIGEIWLCMFHLASDHNFHNFPMGLTQSIASIFLSPGLWDSHICEDCTHMY
jgi:hypothetical protein